MEIEEGGGDILGKIARECLYEKVTFEWRLEGNKGLAIQISRVRVF